MALPVVLVIASNPLEPNIFSRGSDQITVVIGRISQLYAVKY